MEELKRINTESVSNRIVITRTIFLRLLALVYLIAFLSLYGQIQGLWGDEGLLPAKFILQKLKDTQKEKANFFSFPTIAWIFKFMSDKHLLPDLNVIGLHFGSYAENILYVISLIGIVISFLMVINVKQVINSLFFGILWYCYLNFFLIGQVFLRYEWDMLLLEVGFVTILFAPLHYQRYINIITNVDNICFYLLRFLLFKIMFCISSNILASGCPYWLSFTGLNFFFQSQPLLSSFSYTAHSLPDGIKKILSAFGYFIMEYMPFAYFLIWRRFNIFAGQLTFMFNVFIMLCGNYSFYNLLILVINVLNFDDYYWRGVMGNKVIAFLGMDELEETIEEYITEMNEKQELAEKLQAEYNELSEKYKAAKTEEEKKSLHNKMIDIRKETFNLDDYYDSPKIEESIEPTTTLWKEIFVFINFFSVCLLFVFLYAFPIKNILPGRALIRSSKPEEATFVLNIFLIYVFAYIIVVIIYNISQTLKISLMSSFSITPDIIEEMKKSNDPQKDAATILAKTNKSTWISKLKSLLSYGITSMKYLLIISMFVLYFVGSINSLYQGIGVKLFTEEKPKKNKKVDLSMPTAPSDSILQLGVALSNLVYGRFLAYGVYGQIQKKIIGINGRPELEIEYQTEDSTDWEEINFLYKLGKYHYPKFLFFTIPRLDYQMYIAAQANDINSEPWLAILLGKLLEKNPVTLDLLGYEVEEKEPYYKLSMFDKMKNLYLGVDKPIMDMVPRKIKIELYNYKFKEKSKSNVLFMRKKIREFLGNIEKYALSSIFKMYGLPEIDEKRKIYINPFQYIPIVDLLVIFFLLKQIMHI